MKDDLKKDAEARMKKTLETLHTDLAKIRTGRANPGILDHLVVDYYGNLTPINQIANVSTQDSRTLLVTPWEKNMVNPIEKAILNSDLGLNPATVGNAIRIPMPALTEERRKEMIRIVKGEGEQAKIAIRNIRRDINHYLKEELKEKQLSEDDERRGIEIIQKLTDQYIAQVDSVISDKEKDLMEI